MIRSLAVLLVAASIAAPAHAANAPGEEALDVRGEAPRELQDVGIDEHPGAVLPKDLPFRDQNGAQHTLADYLDGQHPLVIVLAYYRCPMLCTFVLNGLGHGMVGLHKKDGWIPGKDFRVLAVSIDPRDTPEMAAKKRANQVAELGFPVGDKGWDFATTDDASAHRLAAALGFRYHFDKAQDQYAHAAGAFIVTPDGRLSRTLYGLNFDEKTMRLALSEASAGHLGSAWDRVLLFCYHYDPDARGYVASARRVMQAGGALTLLGLLGLFLFLRRRYRSRSVTPPAHMRDAHT